MQQHLHCALWEQPQSRSSKMRYNDNNSKSDDNDNCDDDDY